MDKEIVPQNHEIRTQLPESSLNRQKEDGVAESKVKKVPTKPKSTTPVHPVSQWLDVNTTKFGRHSLRVLAERDSTRESILGNLRDLVRGHYVDPKITEKRIASLGAHKTAKLLREHVPTKSRARSGDLGEVLATELAELELPFKVPIRRLRWKDGRETALRGDDIIGVGRTNNNELTLLKGESKSRVNMSSSVINEASAALDRDRGRPTRLSVLFVAERVRELGEDNLAEQLEESALKSFKGTSVSHLLFILTGGTPKNFLEAHLKDVAKKKRPRHAIGVHIKDHAEFINLLFEGL